MPECIVFNILSLCLYRRERKNLSRKENWTEHFLSHIKSGKDDCVLAWINLLLITKSFSYFHYFNSALKLTSTLTTEVQKWPVFGITTIRIMVNICWILLSPFFLRAHSLMKKKIVYSLNQSFNKCMLTEPSIVLFAEDISWWDRLSVHTLLTLLSKYYLSAYYASGTI
jgi:hypothetical protein